MGVSQEATDPRHLELLKRLDQGLWAPEGAAFLAPFGGLALVLAAVGVYGVLAYSVTQQTREIAIRMAIGAERYRVLGLAVGQGLKLTATGLALGILVALALTRQLSSFKVHFVIASNQMAKTQIRVPFLAGIAWRPVRENS